MLPLINATDATCPPVLWSRWTLTSASLPSPRLSWSRWCREWWVIFIAAGERVNADVYRRLLRQHVIPGSEDICWWRLHFPAGFSTSAHCQDFIGVLEREHGGILNCGRAAVFTGFECWTSQCGEFCIGSQGNASCWSGCCGCLSPGMVPAIDALHSQDLPLILPLFESGNWQ